MTVPVVEDKDEAAFFVVGAKKSEWNKLHKLKSKGYFRTNSCRTGHETVLSDPRFTTSHPPKNVPEFAGIIHCDFLKTSDHGANDISLSQPAVPVTGPWTAMGKRSENNKFKQVVLPPDMHFTMLGRDEAVAARVPSSSSSTSSAYTSPQTQPMLSPAAAPVDASYVPMPAMNL